jgi:hypothetical protein
MSSCVKVRSKKYQTRKGPPYHAKDCKGQTKKGNDKKPYISIPDSKGVYKWIPKDVKPHSEQTQTKGIKTYMILDNGSNAFVAKVSPSHVNIYRLKHTNQNGSVLDKKVLDMDYKKIFIGDNDLNIKGGPAPKGMYPGNSILIQTSPGKYIYAGNEIYSFGTINGEKINKYYSIVGNSHVTYPYAVGEHYTYFMLDKMVVPNELLNLKKDAYGQFYGFTVKEEDRKKKIESAKKKFVTKLIHKRNLF